MKIGGFDFKPFAPKCDDRKEHITINYKRHTVTLNITASKHFTKQNIEIGYDANKRAFAIKDSDKTENSRRLSIKSASKKFMSKALCDFIKKLSDTQKECERYSCEWDEKEKMLIFSL